MWDYLSLFKGKHVFIDLPGHGKSGINDQEIPSIDHMVESVIAVLSKEGIQDFDVIGHSMGGYVALGLKDRMSRCRRVVLLNSNYWSDPPKKTKRSRTCCSDRFCFKELFFTGSDSQFIFRPQKTSKRDRAIDFRSEAHVLRGYFLFFVSDEK
jgi:pimeloyl-ACP methyl ester carboxylesterase